MRPITLVFAGCLALAASTSDSSFTGSMATPYSRAMDAYSEEYFRLNREAPHLTNAEMVKRANVAAARALSNMAAPLVTNRIEFTDEEKANLTKIDQFGVSKIGRSDGPSNEVCDVAKDVDKTKDKFKDKCKDDKDDCDVDLWFKVCPIDEDETKISCVGTEYRSIDGACNNLDKPLIGKANTKYARLIPAVYRDDKEELVGTSPFDFYPLVVEEESRSLVVSDRNRRRRTSSSSSSTSASLAKCKKDPGFDEDFLAKFKPDKPPTNTFGGCDPVKKKNLPTAREVSATVHLFKPEEDEREPDDNKSNNLILQSFAQLLDYDISLTPESFAEGCCFAETEEDKNEAKDNCKSIAIPKGDVFPKKNSNSAKDKTPLCLEVKRSSAFCPGTTKVREQFNAITSWVDASNIYGSSVLDTCKLRTFVDGKLDTFEKKDGDKLLEVLLPKDDFGNFFAGDKRVNKRPGLNALTTLFVREHNRIVEEFFDDIAQDKGLRGFEDLTAEFKKGMDEVIYQKAKRVVEGTMQNIVYGKGGFLNQVLGDKNYKKFDLDNEVLEDGTKCDKYDPEVDPTIFNSFSTSAFRFYDSLTRDFVPFVDPTDPFITDEDLEDKKDKGDEGGYWLRDGFFNDDIIADKGADKVLTGIANVKAFPYDKFLTTELTNNFLSDKGEDRTDLAAKNIQRGRDHGIAPYNAYRQACGLKPLCDWNEKPDNISPENWAALEKVYNHPSEIELFSGGLSEKKPEKPEDEDAAQGLLGDTFACLVGRQFQKLKFGDRFFYGFADKDKPVKGQFTSKQIESLKKRTLSGLLCDNVKDLKAVAPNAFKKEERLQDLLKCDDVATKIKLKLDLEPFKDK